MEIVPPIHKDTVKLYPAFRTALTNWLNLVAKECPELEVLPSETWRTLERQRYLYSLNKPGRWMTDMDGVNRTSLHQHGLATDIFIIDKATGKAIWDTKVFLAVYTKVPPKSMGLETLIPSEYGHLQIAGGYDYCKRHLVPVLGG
jgi:hypothetical protein